MDYIKDRNFASDNDNGSRFDEDGNNNNNKTDTSFQIYDRKEKV